MENIIDYALRYAKLGFKVLPLHSATAGRCSCNKADCDSPGKHPRTMNGVTGASADEAQIRKWWSMWPAANIGIATGGASGFFVLDIDGEDGAGSLRDLADELGPLPDTWEQLTGGGGRHLLFALPGFTVGNKVKLLPGLDIRGNGGYIVAAPSVHVSGRMYAWEVTGEPGEAALAALPQIWQTFLRSANTPTRGIAEPIAETLIEGTRNDGLFRLGASMRAKGLSAGAIQAALEAENRARCHPPLPAAEVAQIAESCAKYSMGEPGPLPPRKIDKAGALEAVKSKLPVQEAQDLYCDEILAVAVALENEDFSQYIMVRQLLETQKGFKERDFKQAVKQYKQRQRALRLVKDGEPAELVPLSLLLPEDGFLHGFFLPENWRMDGPEIHQLKTKKDGQVREVACPHPIFPVMRLINADAGTEKVKLAYYRDNEWRNAIVDKSGAAGRREIVALSDRGVQVTSESAKNLINFLSDFETANIKTLPVARSLTRVGWLNLRQFVPYDGELIFDGDEAFKGLFAAVCESGSFEAWRALMERARESMHLRAMLAASFTAPLLWLLDAQCFFVHLWGTKSGIGKSVALQSALSVWGNPDNLWRSFNSTETAMERTAGFFHSLPLGMDELQTFNLQWRGGIKQLVYRLTQGQGRGRGRRDGGMDSVSRWRTVILTTGEQPLGEDLSTEGALARVIELYLTGGDYPKGLSPQELVAGIQAHHGHAGRRYIAALISWMDGRTEPLAELLRSIAAELKILAGSYGGKQMNALALLALGDCLASRFVFDMDEDAALWEAVNLAGAIAKTLVTRAETDAGAQAWDWMMNWLAVNREHFATQGNNVFGQLFGAVKSAPGGEAECCIISSVLNDALVSAGFSPRAIIRGWADDGRIMRNKEGKPSTSRHISNMGPTKCYVLRGDWLNADAESD